MHPRHPCLLLKSPLSGPPGSDGGAYHAATCAPRSGRFLVHVTFRGRATSLSFAHLLLPLSLEGPQSGALGPRASGTFSSTPRSHCKSL